MTEHEMEDLLWEYPERFLNEPLKQFQRQPASAVGRADLIFEDKIGRLLVIELKRDTLERGAITQLVDYYGMLKTRFPHKSVELMIVASRIPPERRVACEQYNIEAREISQKRFRDVAEEAGYTFKSEAHVTVAANELTTVKPQAPAVVPIHSVGPYRSDSPFVPMKVEKGWYFWKASNGRGYFLAFVNARGSCSMRTFEAEDGLFQRREYKSGDFQDSFSDYVKAGVALCVSRQPNLERDCRNRLPAGPLSELRQQIHS
jgi:hypothetical protein